MKVCRVEVILSSLNFPVNDFQSLNNNANFGMNGPRAGSTGSGHSSQSRQRARDRDRSDFFGEFYGYITNMSNLFPRFNFNFHPFDQFRRAFFDDR